MKDVKKVDKYDSHLLTNDEINDLRDRFLNKKISLKTKEGELCVGICKFLGRNKNFPSWDLQVTLDRTPITHVNHKTIKIYNK